MSKLKLKAIASKLLIQKGEIYVQYMIHRSTVTII